jgi:tRNA 2-thiouridine synthesizing protein D
MKYSLAIYGAPYSSQAPQTALLFAQALLDAGHSIARVFFYMDGVHNATGISSPPQNEQNIPADWAALISQHGIDAVVCIAAALRRGVIDKAESERYEKPAHNLSEPFGLSGLGQLVEAGIDSDRLITFGP